MIEIKRALSAASIACAVTDRPLRVRVLAAAALVEMGEATRHRAAKLCCLADQAQVSPSRLGKAGVTAEMIAGLVAHLRTGAEIAPQPDPRPSMSAPERKAARLAEAKRLYLDENLSLRETGKRLVPPIGAACVWTLLREAGVETRPRGTVSPLVGRRADGSARSRPRYQRCPAPVTPRRLVRIKPVTADVLRWADAYARRRVDPAYLADLFDVDAADLQRRLRAA